MTRPIPKVLLTLVLLINIYFYFFQAEAHPSPQITWFKETYNTDSAEPTLVQIHHEPTINDKQTQTIDVFGDFFQQVLK